MNDILLIKPQCREKSKAARLSVVLNRALDGKDVETVTTIEELEDTDCRGRKLLFAICLGESGVNLEYYKILKRIRLEKECFAGSVGAVIVDGNSELFTKDIARSLVFSANAAGCAFVGKPLVEGTRSLNNYNIVAKNLEMSNENAYIESACELVERLHAFEFEKKKQPNILMLYSGDENKSNTYQLWESVRRQLTGCNITEISLRDGQIFDCAGCSYDLCLHYGEMRKCFYGGVITTQVYPAIINSDALVLACPNYNDAVGANHTAFINRLTSIFRANSFFEKQLYAIIVSGYSGGDIVAQQLIGGINMNKAFILPPSFALIETANNPGTIKSVQGIESKVKEFADNMKKWL